MLWRMAEMNNAYYSFFLCPPFFNKLLVDYWNLFNPVTFPLCYLKKRITEICLQRWNILPSLAFTAVKGKHPPLLFCLLNVDNPLIIYFIFYFLATTSPILFTLDTDSISIQCPPILFNDMGWILSYNGKILTRGTN